MHTYLLHQISENDSVLDEISDLHVQKRIIQQRMRVQLILPHLEEKYRFRLRLSFMYFVN